MNLDFSQIHISTHTAVAMESFNISANPGTDIWKKPPKEDIFNAASYAHRRPPLVAPVSNTVTKPLATFESARVSFSAKWSSQYDQAGLLLAFHPPGTAAPEGEGVAKPAKWIKTGLEMYNSVPRIGTVACDSWADWSLSPVQKDGDADDGVITVSIERENTDGFGHGIWVYQVVGEEKHPLREITWGFASPEMDGWDLSVSAFAARPHDKTEEALDVKFQGMEVVWGEEDV
ncbi:hypothetical protein MKZ38_010094 [Zalerion maritima]|uniref:Uncharacterized protein n=1 Tax=Zalerion maritima TaxID=339359 RepID=A0AAD5S117_9PEZI|nr:hypothetical protein MKZ38_010094 [Zalerion maritima]